MANEARFYRKVSTVEEAQQAIHELTDHVYDLRSQVDGHKATIEKMQKQTAQLGKGINSQIMGLNVNGTPPKNNQKLTYNAATGEIEWQ